MKKTIFEYKNRFYELMDSEMGNVKPLIIEGQEDIMRYENIRDVVLPQLKEIIENYDLIDCENVDPYNFMDDSPEYSKIYCMSYSDKTKEEMIQIYKNKVEEMNSLVDFM